MVTVISRFRVRNGLEEEVGAAFASRPRLVEKAAGLRGLEVLTDATDPSIFLRGKMGQRAPEIVLGGGAYRVATQFVGEVGAVGPITDLREALAMFCP